MRIRTLIVGLAAVAAVTHAAAQPLARRAGQGGGIPAVKQFLNLSDQQIQELTALRKEQQNTLAPLHKQIQEKAAALAEARKATNPDPTAIGQLVLDVQRLRERVQSVNREYHEKALALLDATQKEKLTALENVTRRAAGARGAAAGAGALNLLLPPAMPRPAGGARP